MNLTFPSPHFSYTDVVPRRVESFLCRAPRCGPLWNPLESNPGGLCAHPGSVHPFTVDRMRLGIAPTREARWADRGYRGSPHWLLGILASRAPDDKDRRPLLLPELHLPLKQPQVICRGWSWVHQWDLHRDRRVWESISLLVGKHRCNASSMGIGWMDLTTWMFSTNLMWWILLKV